MQSQTMSFPDPDGDDDVNKEFLVFTLSMFIRENNG